MKPTIVSAAALTLFLLTTYTTTLVNADDDRCGIRCIFKGESAELPTHTYDVPTNETGEIHYQVKIYSGSCSSFDFTGGSTTKYLNLSTFEVHHETTDISTTECNTYYDVIDASTGSTIEASGYATFSLSIPSILTGMRITLDPQDSIPNGAELTKCVSPTSTFTLTSATKLPEIVKGALEADGTAEDAICRSIKGLMSQMTSRFSSWVDTIRAGKDEPTPPKPYVPTTAEEAADYCDLSRSAVLNVARYAVNDVIGAEGVEAIMNFITNNTGHAWANMSADILVGIIGGYLTFVTSSVMYSFPEADFYHINEWESVMSGLPAKNIDNYSFVTSAKMGALKADAQWLAENIIYNRQWEQLGFNDEYGNVKIGFKEPSANVIARILINSTFLKSLTPPQLIEPGCLLHSLKEFRLSSVSINASSISDKGFTFEHGDFEEEFTEALNSFSAIFAEAYAPHQVGIINGYYIPDHLFRLNLEIGNFLRSDWPCPEREAYVAPPVINFLALWITLGATFGLWFILIIVTVIVKYVNNKKENHSLQQKTPVYKNDDAEDEEDDEEVFAGEDERLINPTGTPGTSPVYGSDSRKIGSSNNNLSEQEAVKNMPSLVMMDSLSPILRYLMPLLIFVNVSMFIVSNASISASVFPTVVFGDFPVEVGSLFDFGLINTIRDMWSAGVYPLAILIAFFSGAWPYIKLILMFLSWCLPPRVLPLRIRENILRVVDALGKWSLIDSYVMTLMLVAFRYHIVFPVADESDPMGPPPSYVDVIVDARVGFVLFVLATMLSLVLGHVILAIHRSSQEKIINNNINKQKNINSIEDNNSEGAKKQFEKIALRSVAFKSMGANIKTDNFMQILITILLVISLALVCVGISIQSLAYDVRGLVGWLFGLMDLDRRSEYSLLETGARVLSASANPNSFTAILILVIFFATSVVFPLLHLLVLIFLWLTPLSLKAQRRVYVLVEVLNAWSALDVYVVSCLAALLQLRQFALWIVGDSCDFINPFIEKYLGDVVPGDPVCFDLVAKLDNGSWVLLAACIIYIIASYIVMGRCHTALEARKEEDKK